MVFGRVFSLKNQESFKKYGLDSAGRLPQSKLADLFETLYPDPRIDWWMKESWSWAFLAAHVDRVIGWTNPSWVTL